MPSLRLAAPKNAEGQSARSVNFRAAGHTSRMPAEPFSQLAFERTSESYPFPPIHRKRAHSERATCPAHSTLGDMQISSIIGLSCIQEKMEKTLLDSAKDVCLLFVTRNKSGLNAGRKTNARCSTVLSQTRPPQRCSNLARRVERLSPVIRTVERDPPAPE